MPSSPGPPGVLRRAVGVLHAHHGLVTALFLAAYLALLCRAAAGKPFWYDELFTVYLARSAGPAELWGHLARGTDLNPPLGYLLTRACVAAGGERPLAVRLPSILAFAVCLVCVYRFVRRRFGWVEASVVVLFLAAGKATFYAFEARPYALVLAFAGLALVAWQRAAERARSWSWSVLVLGVSLALALSAHYYAVLLYLPFACGEAMRAWTRRRPDVPVALVLGLSGLPLLAYRPLLAAAKPYAGGFWARPSWTFVRGTYETFLGEMGVPLLAALALLFLVTAGRRRSFQGEGEEVEVSGYRPHELAAIAGFSAIPLAGVVLGVLATGVFTQRYVLSGSIGLCALLGAAALPLTRGPRPATVALLLALAAWCLASPSSILRTAAGPQEDFRKSRALLERCAAPGEAVVFAHSQRFLRFCYYGGEVPFRPLYLADVDLPRTHGDYDTDCRGLLALRRVAGLPVVEFEKFVGQARPFLLYGREGWLTRELDKRGYTAKVCGDGPDGKLYRMCPPPS